MIDWSRTVHGIGDLHAGALSPARAGKVIQDVIALARPPGRPPALHLQIGDVTDNGTAAQDRHAKDWLGRLPGQNRYTILGNHDIWRDARTPAQWARAYGYPSQNFVIDDLSFVRILAVGPDRMPRGDVVLSQATLDWLDQELGRAPGDCWIACHWPLYGTVLGDRRKYYTSEMPTFHAKPREPIRRILAGHPNAKAWLSGHTHSPLSARGLVARFRLPGGRWILAVNFSALVGVGKTREPTHPLRTLYLTHHPGHIEVRYRDHRRPGDDRAPYWGAVGGPGYLVAGVPPDS
jgi:hypothetical protein